MDQNRIEKQIELKAPLSKVWQALTDSQKFGSWFGTQFEGPFEAGQSIKGKITHPGYEHLTWMANVERIEPERYFSFTWHPYGIDPEVDYSTEIPTLVEFFLEESTTGTRIKLVESGFEHVPAHRRAEAFRMNDQGWAQQMKNIEKYVSA